MRASTQVTWNALTKWIAILAKAGVEVVIVTFLVRTLGKAGYGLSGIAAVIVSLATVADLGLRGALARQLSASAARKDFDRFNTDLNSALGAYATIGLIAAGCCVALAHVLARAFRIPEQLMPQAVFLIRIYASSAFIVTLFRTTFSAVLISHHRYDLLNYVNAAMGILRGLALFLILSLTQTGLYGWALGSLASLVAAAAATYLLARRVCPQLSLNTSKVHWSAVRGLLSLGAYFLTINLVGMLGEHSDPIILTSILGPTAVALYRPARLLSGMGRTFVLAMAGQLHPLTTQYHVTGQKIKLQWLLIRGTRYTFLMGVPVCVFLSVFAHPIVYVWLGEELGESYRTTAWLLAILAITELFAYAGGAQGAIMIGMKRLRFAVLLNLPLAALNLVGSVLLVALTPLGVLGVLIPTLFAFAVRRIAETIYVARISSVGLRRYLLESYLRPAGVLLILGPTAIGLNLLIQPRSLVSLLLSAVALGSVWIAATWLLGFNREDRQGFTNLLRRGAGKFISSS